MKYSQDFSRLEEWKTSLLIQKLELEMKKNVNKRLFLMENNNIL